MTLGGRGRGCCAAVGCRQTTPAAVQAKIVMMDRFKVIPLVLEFIVGANEQRWVVMSMLLQARNPDWKKGVLGLLTNHVDLACGTLFATTR